MEDPTDPGLLAKAVRQITGELAGLDETVAAEAEKLLVNTRRSGTRTRPRVVAAAGFVGRSTT